MFGDAGVLLRVVVKNGVATIEVHGIDRKTAERVERFNHKVKNGKALTIGSLFSGGGIIDAALHE
jgi:DNA (cytosine-5)-methyltransferase 1